MTSRGLANSLVLLDSLDNTSFVLSLSCGNLFLTPEQSFLPTTHYQGMFFFFFSLLWHISWFSWPNTHVSTKMLNRFKNYLWFQVKFCLGMSKKCQVMSEVNTFWNSVSILLLCYTIVLVWLFIKKHFRTNFKINK